MKGGKYLPCWLRHLQFHTSTCSMITCWMNKYINRTGHLRVFLREALETHPLSQPHPHPRGHLIYPCLPPQTSYCQLYFSWFSFLNKRLIILFPHPQCLGSSRHPDVFSEWQNGDQGPMLVGRRMVDADKQASDTVQLCPRPAQRFCISSCGPSPHFYFCYTRLENILRNKSYIAYPTAREWARTNLTRGSRASQSTVLMASHRVAADQ